MSSLQHRGPSEKLSLYEATKLQMHRSEVPASERLLVIRAVQSVLQLAHVQGRAQADGVDGVGVARHEGDPLVVIAVRAQERENLVVGVCQNDIPLQGTASMLITAWV